MDERFDPRLVRGCVAVAVEDGSDLSAAVGAHFGRSPRFLLVQGGPEAAVRVVENPHVDAAQGAGPAAASLLVREGVTTVLAGQFGPKAEDALRGGGLLPVAVQPGTGVREALAELQAAEGPAGG
jgi:predicted Fe-Mo cluster-binding NifX family protein